MKTDEKGQIVVGETTAAVVLEPTHNLRWVEAYEEDDNDKAIASHPRWSDARFKLQQLWIDKRTGYQEWRDVEIEWGL